MIYSRFLHTECWGSLALGQNDCQYLVFSTPQSHTPSLGFRKTVGLQRFAVLWSGELDLRAITIIEQALVNRVLSPIKVLQVGHGRLDIIIDKNLGEEKLRAFVFAMDALVGKAFEKKRSMVILTEDQEWKICEKTNVLAWCDELMLNSAEFGILDYSGELRLTNPALPLEPISGSNICNG